MPAMNTAQHRVIDPILSEHVRGYVQPGHVGHVLFPEVPVDQYGGKIITFGKEAFRLYNSKRAPGAATTRIEYGYDGDPYAIVPSALEALVPREHMNDAKQVPSVDLASGSVDMVMDALHLEREHTSAMLARDESKYNANHKVTLTGTAKWTSSTATPSDDIEAASEAVRSSIGLPANTVVLSAKAFSALKHHPTIIERMKYTQRDSLTTELLATLWDIDQVVVGKAVFASGQDDDLSDVWGNDVIVAYMPPVPAGRTRDARRPSYGYTYTLRGHPLVEDPYYENNRKSWVYGVSYDNTPVLSGMTAGFLIKDAGAPQ